MTTSDAGYARLRARPGVMRRGEVRATASRLRASRPDLVACAERVRSGSRKLAPLNHVS
jgi:hypothetical protein